VKVFYILSAVISQLGGDFNVSDILREVPLASWR